MQLVTISRPGAYGEYEPYEICAKMTIKGVGCYGQEIEGVSGHICYKLSAIGRCARANEGYISSLGTV